MIDMNKLDQMIARMTTIRSGERPLAEPKTAQFKAFMELWTAIMDQSSAPAMPSPQPTMDHLYPKLTFMGAPVAEKPHLTSDIVSDREDHLRSVMRKSVLERREARADYVMGRLDLEQNHNKEKPPAISDIIDSRTVFYVGYNAVDGVFISIQPPPSNLATLDFRGSKHLHNFKAGLIFCIDPCWLPFPRRPLSALGNPHLPNAILATLREFIQKLRDQSGPSETQAVDDVWTTGFSKRLLAGIRDVVTSGRIDLLRALETVTL